MREYGVIHVSFWSNKELASKSDATRLLAAYLVTGPHTTLLGCFRCPIGYICTDLGWDKKKLRDAQVELSDFATWEGDWVFIHKFLRWNSIKNPKQGQGVARLFDQLPMQLKMRGMIAKALLEYAQKLPDGYQDSISELVSGHGNSIDTVSKLDQDDGNSIETVSKRSRKADRERNTASEPFGNPSIQEQEQIQEKIQEQTQGDARARDAASPVSDPVRNGQSAQCPAPPAQSDPPPLPLRTALERLRDHCPRFVLGPPPRKDRERRSGALEQATLGLPLPLWRQLQGRWEESDPSEDQLDHLAAWWNAGGWDFLDTITPQRLATNPGLYEALTQSGAWDGKSPVGKQKQRPPPEKEQGLRNKPTWREPGQKKLTYDEITEQLDREAKEREAGRSTDPGSGRSRKGN